MVQLHCPRCQYTSPASGNDERPRTCPHCAKSNVIVPLAAIATLPRRNGLSPAPAA